MAETIVIIGNKGSGKTSVGFMLLESIYKTEKKKAYIYQFPIPEALKKCPIPITNITHLEDLDNISNGVVLIDEASIVFNPIEKTMNKRLLNILQISRHNNLTLILIAHNTYFINRSLFSLIDTFIFKRVGLNHFETERPHIKRIFEDKVRVIREINIAYIYNDFVQEYISVPKLKWFSNTLSKAYRKGQKQKSILDIYCPKLNSPQKKTPKVRKVVPKK